MPLITAQQIARLRVNGMRQRLQKSVGPGIDFKPVVKLLLVDGLATWLLTELDPDNPDRVFGLYDPEIGRPELGYLSLRKLSRRRGWLRLPVERDRDFRADRPLSAYIAEARMTGSVRA